MERKVVSGITPTLLLIMLLMCSLPPIVRAETTGASASDQTSVTLEAIADSHVNSSSPHSNYGSLTSLKIEITTGSTKDYTYTYVMFDLSSIPSGAVITSAKLSLYMTGISGLVPMGIGRIYVHYCSDTSWTELGITWNNKPPFDSEATSYRSFGPVVPVPQYYDWDVTSDVSRALSNGKLAEVVKWSNYTDSDVWARARFQSKEAAHKPKLTVEYLPAPPPAYIVVRGLNNRIYHRMYNPSSGSWDSWNVLPTGMTCDSPAVAICGGKLHIVVRGFSKTNVHGNYTLWYGWINLTDGSFHGWTWLSGRTSSAPTLACYDSQLILVIRGLNNRVYYRSYDCVSDEWEGWFRVLTGITCDSPAAAVLGDELHMVVRGYSATNVYGNYSLWHGSLNLTTESFSGWTKLPGLVSSAPALAGSQTLNKLYVIIRGLNNRIYYNTWNGINWEGQTLLPSGSTSDGPAAAVLGDELHMVVRGRGATTLWHYYINLSTDDHAGWNRISGATPSAPTLTS